jgi:hypothetical protein
MTTPSGVRGSIARPTLCGLLILVSALPFAVVAPRLKAEYDHMHRGSEVAVAPVALSAPRADVNYHASHLPQVQDGRRRKELSR